MAFRLSEIQIESTDYNTERIVLINKKNDKEDNHFSLIVGNNGTGKSRLLGNIARVLNKKYKLKSTDFLNFTGFEMSMPPSKIIAVSNSLSDKFPSDSFFGFNGVDALNYREERYNYLGTRGRMGSSSHYLMRRAVDILLENYSNKYVSKCYRHVFDYLDYLPVIKLEYKIIHIDITKNQEERINPGHVLEYIDKKSRYSTINKNIFQNFKEKYEDKLLDVCNFLNDLRINKIGTYELEIDFSYSNINKIDRDNSIYEEDLRIYDILNILRKINMIRGFSIRLYKKNNKAVNFADASSGEANILTTLIALIPLVEDNCCVLIDEPEISLHPTWQYRYVELLTKIFENFKGCHIIIASHSHFIVSDLPANNSSVISLKMNDGIIKSDLLYESTYGWSAEDILLNVFEMPTTRNYYISIIVSEALELIAKNNKKGDRFLELSGELFILEKNLKKEDPLKMVINSILNIDNK